VFDADYDVRELALAGLRYRRFDEYSDELTAAIRYPWAPAARHAATAIVRLEVKETIPSLINILQEPDPVAPFAVEKNGKQVFAVRELVRVNHHRNCQLCHAPAGSADRDDPGQVLATVPSPAEPLPPSISLEYYGWQRAPVVAVRADTTYLRQDFSALLPVSDAKPWPDRQRFDFMVRTRALGAEETAMRMAHVNAKCSSPQHEAALMALRHLTGHDFGPDVEAWRRWSGEGAMSRGVNKPAW
jgi:mono/diheme cytochrome c family protein